MTEKKEYIENMKGYRIFENNKYRLKETTPYLQISNITLESINSKLFRNLSNSVKRMNTLLPNLFHNVNLLAEKIICHKL